MEPSTNTETVLDLSSVPTKCHDLQEVFSKSKALSLPPHKPQDSTIELLSGSTRPSSWLYNLSRPECAAMEKYIKESLGAGIIQRLSSQVGTSFLWGKRMALSGHAFTSGASVILPSRISTYYLISSAFRPFHSATGFTKPHIRNAYHFFQINQGDKWKTVLNMPLGDYEYLVMPPGLTNAPAMFQD